LRFTVGYGNRSAKVSFRLPPITLTSMQHSAGVQESDSISRNSVSGGVEDRENAIQSLSRFLQIAIVSVEFGERDES
jgi:hypothetical protein